MIVASAPELCQKFEFFLKKRMKGIFADELEFMITFDKVQNNSPLMCTKFEILGQNFESYSSFSLCMHSSVYRVFWPNIRVSK